MTVVFASNIPGSLWSFSFLPLLNGFCSIRLHLYCLCLGWIGMANVRCKKKYGKLLLENVDEKNVVGTCKSMRLTLETKEISCVLRNTMSNLLVS